ncbi:MAG: helix-turn-helix transcriptional regulator [Niastella sp.]|nr:helix-turn-helix transcriptional regulator [Niastella sp.]
MQLIAVTTQEIERLNLAARIIEERMREPLTINQLAAKVKLSEVKLKSGFKQVYGIPPYTYLLEVRMKKAKLMLLAEEPIKAIAMTVGYKNESNFCKAFKKICHESPGAWIKNKLKQTG